SKLNKILMLRHMVCPLRFTAKDVTAYVGWKPRSLALYVLHRPEDDRAVLVRIVGQSVNVRSVGPHDVDLTVRLGVVRVQRGLVLEAPAAAGERDPLAVRRPRAVGVATRRIRYPLEVGAVGLDRADFVIPVHVVRKSDKVVNRRPGRKVDQRR